MAELTISSDEIRSAVEDYVSSFSTDTSREEVGVVTYTGDGIARLEGLPSAMANELLEFPGGVLGVALNLDEREIGAVILGSYETIEEGQQVQSTGTILSVPVGDAFLGRTIDPLGNPIDGLGDIEAEEQRVLELQAVSVVQRQPVKEPLQTGIKAVDSMTPIGRGQRQLIIGDRKTGKTAVCTDTIVNQRGNWETGDPDKQVRCIYVAIGQKGSTVAAVRESLEEAGGAGIHHHRRRPGVGLGGVQVAGPLHRLGHRTALDVPGQARPHRVRRPVQARRRLPRHLPAAAPPTGSRGLPR